jgi:hypothetical protein
MAFSGPGIPPVSTAGLMTIHMHTRDAAPAAPSELRETATPLFAASGYAHKLVSRALLSAKEQPGGWQSCHSPRLAEDTGTQSSSVYGTTSSWVGGVQVTGHLRFQCRDPARSADLAQSFTASSIRPGVLTVKVINLADITILTGIYTRVITHWWSKAAILAHSGMITLRHWTTTWHFFPQSSISTTLCWVPICPLPLPCPSRVCLPLTLLAGSPCSPPPSPPCDLHFFVCS